MTLNNNQKGNYRFLTGIAPYSSGVLAMAGYEIIRVRLRQPIPLKSRIFERIQRYLSGEDRPIQALCSMEFRIPAPLSFGGFIEFNNEYQQMLKDQDLLLGEVNPIARTNISPAEIVLKDPVVYAFSYTARVNDDYTLPSFIVAGAGDLDDQANLKSSAIVRPNELNPDALEEKVKVVMKVMNERLLGLGANYDEVSSISIYTTIPLHTFIKDAILKPIGTAALQGVNWYYSNPPIKGLAYEMDMRGIRKELVLEI